MERDIQLYATIATLPRPFANYFREELKIHNYTFVSNKHSTPRTLPGVKLLVLESSKLVVVVVVVACLNDLNII